MDNLRAAIVGLGKMGLLHASILNMMPNVEVVALCDKSSLLLKFVKKLFKESQILKDVEQLSDLDIDFAYVTTPIPVHYPIVKSLYSNNVTNNLFVEKTLADSWDKAKELAELSKKFGGIDMVGYMKRFTVTFQKAKTLLDQGIIGEITSFNAYAYSSDFLDVKDGFKGSGSRGGVIGDLGSHVIDLALFFFGDFDVESVFIDSGNEIDFENSAQFDIKKSGLVGHFNFSWCMNNYRMPYFGLEIKGEKGVINVDDDMVELILGEELQKWYRHDLDDSVNFMLGVPEFYREDEYFVNSIISGNKTELCFQKASRVDNIIDQIQKKAGVNG